MRSSIVGGGGIAQEVRQELVQLFEKVVIEEDLSDSVQRYQEANENSRTKLDFAVCPGVWLWPSNLEINLTIKVGYNNFLQKATRNMQLGVNKVNEPTTKHRGQWPFRKLLPYRPRRHQRIIKAV